MFCFVVLRFIVATWLHWSIVEEMQNDDIKSVKDVPVSAHMHFSSQFPWLTNEMVFGDVNYACKLNIKMRSFNFTGKEATNWQIKKDSRRIMYGVICWLSLCFYFCLFFWHHFWYSVFVNYCWFFYSNEYCSTESHTHTTKLLVTMVQ